MPRGRPSSCNRLQGEKGAGEAPLQTARQPASPQPLPSHSESGSPPPSLRPRTNHRRAAHCGRACPPTPAPPPSAPRSCPRLSLAGVWLPTFRLQHPARPQERGQAVRCPPCWREAMAQTQCSFASGMVRRDSGETETVRRDSGILKRRRHSCAEAEVGGQKPGESPSLKHRGPAPTLSLKFCRQVEMEL